MVKKKLVKKILQFRDARDWKQFHSPKNLVDSVAIEAAELIEVFQWIDNEKSEEYAKENIKKVEKEVADIAIYLTYLCNDLDIDIDEVVEDKLKENNLKYPEDKAKGNSKKYTELK